MNDTKRNWVKLCVGGKTGGAIWVCLHFLHQGKRWKRVNRRTDRKSKATKVRCSFDKFRINLDPACQHKRNNDGRKAADVNVSNSRQQ
jgi:hypothetical protein